MPTEYTGPVTDDANLFSQYGGTNGGFGMPTITEMTDPQSLWAGKSFGVLGQGLTTGVIKSTGSDYAIDLGVTPNDKQSDGVACYPHYMIITIAPKLKDTTTYGPITLSAGAKAWKSVVTNDYKKPVQPTAAAEPTITKRAASLILSLSSLLVTISLI